LVMIMAAISISTRAGDRILTRRHFLATGYGDTPELAHALLVLALTSSTHPVLVDADGVFHRIPRRRLRTILVWRANDSLVN
jgi:hypothetical protein